jgi:endonuclease YncB( thermonuclease family)
MRSESSYFRGGVFVIATLLSILAIWAFLAFSNGGTTTADAQVRVTSAPRIVQVDHVYDGDTFYFLMPGMWPELARIGVRVRGIDTPEIKGKCVQEVTRAKAARLFTYNLLKTTQGKVELYNVKWDKYGGRVDADVAIGGVPLARELIKNGLAREYFGGKRTGWCA